MHRFIVLLLSAVALASAQSPFAGRWDLTVTTPKETYPSWLEFTEKGGQPSVRVQGQVSSVHPVKDLKVTAGKLTFTTSEWFGKPTPVDWEFTAKTGSLSGIQKRSDGIQGRIAGVPAPTLQRPAPTAWTKPEPLFNGKDLTGWGPDDPKQENHWVAKDGQLVNEKPGANLLAKRKFQDFKLHVELNCPKDGNSGIYLRGRYEMQVAYEAQNDHLHGMASIYGFIAPAAMPDKPGQWESFDITLIGRRVTIVRDGKTVIDNQEIPGITGGAIDSREAEPGPLYIQGDHTGGMKYRNITISVPAAAR